MRGHVQHIARRARLDPLSPEQLAQLRDVPVQSGLRRRRRRLAPERVDELVAGDYLAPMQEQHHEHRALLGAGRRELAARVEHPQRAQEPELQYVPAGG